jgi:ABC-type phosphate/phosphonate transport system substrate-binding protein
MNRHFMLRKAVWSLVAGTLLAAATAARAGAELVLAAPPRDTGGAETDVYQPIADYLSAKLKKTVVYRHTNNWITYQNDMRAGKYDIVFDGPHFAAWRQVQLGHEPLVRLQGQLGFVVVVRHSEDRFTSVKQLAGRPVCGFAPPNFVTLQMYALFDNPLRQPLLVDVTNFQDAYQGVLNGRCVGAAIRDSAYKKLEGEKQATKVLAQGKVNVNQTFTAGPRLSAAERNLIAEALLSPEARSRLNVFFERYSKDKDLVRANPEDYGEQIALLLKDTYGFEISPAKTSPR